MPVLAKFALIMFAIDFGLAILVGALVYYSRESFWYRHDHKTNGKILTLFEVFGTLTAVLFVVFSILHIWVWAPASSVYPVFPFFYTWGLALCYGLIFAIFWMIPIKRALQKLEEAMP